MSKVIVIVGVTGTQGSSVASTFQDLPGWKVRGTTRDPSKPEACALADRGVEVVRAELDDIQSLVEAFDGAHAIYAVTDFWAPFFDPANAAKAKAAGQTPNEYAFDIEVRRGLNIAEAAAEPRVLQTLDRFIFSTLADVKKWSGGKYTWVYHFDSKAKVTEHVRAHMPELAKQMSTLQIGEYATNWKKLPSMAPKKQSDGMFVLTKPQSGSNPIPMVFVEKDTGSFVKALVESPAGTNLLGCGSLIDWTDYMKLWSGILKVHGRFETVPMESFVQKFPEFVAREIGESYAFQGEFGWTDGDPSVLLPKDLKVHCPTTSIEEYIAQEDWSSIL